MHHQKGSLWRKWDLHFHTPSSYDYQDKGATNADIIDTLVDAGVRVVAITDHHVIDTERIRDLQLLGAERITVLPGIEFCSELGGHNSVHFIGLFHEDSDIEHIWHDISAKLELTPKYIEERGGYQRIYIDIKDASKLIHKHHGLVSIHAGTKGNTLEGVTSKSLFKQALKSDLIKDHVVDILEIGKEADLEIYNDIVFPNLQECLPIIICSDNHKASEFKLKANCWVKADPSFYGLLQALIEPEDRIYIGETPPKRKKVSANTTKYIRSVNISKSDESDLAEIWFDDVILDLNHDLVAIIGNKGTGKSALAEVIGLLGNSQNEPSFEFLNSKRFRSSKDNLSRHFQASLYWECDTVDQMSLNQNVNPDLREKVKFIPQGLFEEICNDLAAGNENKFNEELENVIFSHVSEVERLGKGSLSELLDYLTEETYEAIRILKGQLHDTNNDIRKIEGRLTPEHQAKLQNQLESKQNELEAHRLTKPKPVYQPDESAEAAQIEISTELQDAKHQYDELSERLQLAEEVDRKNALLVSTADTALDKIQNFKQKYRLFKTELEEDLKKIGVNFDEVVQFEISLEPIQEKRTNFISERTIAQEQQAESDEGLPNQIASVEKKIQRLQEKLDEPTQLYEKYLTELEEWEQIEKQTIGSEAKPDSLTYYKARLAELTDLPAKLVQHRNHRLSLAKGIYKEIEKLAATYERLYQPVQDFSKEYGFSDDSFDLQFDVSIVDTGFEDRFFDWIGKNRTGSFYGNGEKVLKNLLDRHDFNGWTDVDVFLDELLDHLKKDHRQTGTPSVRISEQLRKGQDVVSLYDYIFSLDYLRPRYVLKLDDKQLGQLSPGERGALLLIFYLLVDQDDIPLIIDQPEENLDNQTVYQRLVSGIKNAKERRQILVVTHNPNLAVVCDAEQIICCSMDKKNGNRMDYISGAIENPDINAKIVDILEGTKPAFNNRRAKYAPFDNQLKA